MNAFRSSQVQELVTVAGRPKALWVIHGETHGSIRTHGLETHLAKVICFLDQAFGRARPGCQGAQKQGLCKVPDSGARM